MILCELARFLLPVPRANDGPFHSASPNDGYSATPPTSLRVPSGIRKSGDLRVLLFVGCTRMASHAKQRLVVVGNGMAPGPRPRAAVRDRARRLRRDDLQRRAAGELRPHHAVAGAVGRQVVRGDRDPRRRLVRQARRHPLQGRQGHRRSTARAHRHRRVRAVAHGPALAAAAGHRRLRQADRRHRLQPHHHPGARPRPAGRADLPRPRRRRGHAAGRASRAAAPSSSAAACSAWRRPPACRRRAWTSPSCT